MGFFLFWGGGGGGVRLDAMINSTRIEEIEVIQVELLKELRIIYEFF